MYLNAHSFFSLRYGTLSPQQLVEAVAVFKLSPNGHLGSARLATSG